MRSVDVAVVDVVDAMANSGDDTGNELGADTESTAHGEEEPMPRELLDVLSVRKFAESRVVAPL